MRRALRHMPAWVVPLIIAIIGFFCLLFPKTLYDSEEGFLGFLGSIIRGFPQGARPWIARGFGILMVLAAGGLYAVIQDSDPTLMNLQRKQFSEQLAEEINERQDRLVASRNDDNDLILYPSNEPLDAILIKLDAFAYKEVSIEEAAETLLSEAEAHFSPPATSVPGPPHSSTAAAETPGGAIAAQAVDPLVRAQRMIENADRAWKNGNMGKALEFARRAESIYVGQLGEGHEKVANVRKMIQAAEQMIAQPPPQATPETPVVTN